MSPTLGSSQLPVTAIPGDPTHSSLHRHMQRHVIFKKDCECCKLYRQIDYTRVLWTIEIVSFNHKHWEIGLLMYILLLVVLLFDSRSYLSQDLLSIAASAKGSNQPVTNHPQLVCMLGSV